MLANWITLSRLPMLLTGILALYLGSPLIRFLGVALLFLGLLLDTVDGIVARRARQTSLFGSVLDIAADRTYELVLWVCFADLGMISVAIPVIVLVRTALTDAFRSLGVAEGIAPFEQHRSALGRFLVTSTWMRVAYSVSKTVTFCGLALVQAFDRMPPGIAGSSAAAAATPGLRVMAWVTVALCVGRGLPVIVRAVRSYWGRDDSPRPAAA